MRTLKYGLSIAAGLLIYTAVLQRPWALAMASKATGGDVPCSWAKLSTLPFSWERLQTLQKKDRQQLKIEQTDDRLWIELIHTSTRSFWIKKSGTLMDGPALLGYVIAEQEWISEAATDYNVRPGDVVVDVGAHIGTFGDDALRKGAAKVVMVEPDPVNLECIRRNFAAEIASGKVIVAPVGAWSKTDILRFKTGVANSGTGTFTGEGESDHQEIQVPVRRLDDILESAGISHVDFIKMDIEGAEREALKGAIKTLAQSKPRLMMDMYHRPDDDVVLPRLIMEANPAYRPFCAVCSPGSDNRMVPYATFFK